MRLYEITLPEPDHIVKKNFYDIYRSVTRVKGRNGKPRLSIKKRDNPDLPDEIFYAGIYAWWHPKFGYFYIGKHAGKTQPKKDGPINTDYKNDMSDRWNKHIQKLLDICTTADQMKNWKNFSKRFTSLGFGLEDFKDVEIHFWPIDLRKNHPPGYDMDKEFTDAIGKKEMELVNKHNPAANKEYDQERRSATRFPDTLKEPQDYERWRQVEIEKQQELEKKVELKKQKELRKQERLLKKQSQQ